MTGIDRRAILRTDPAPAATDFEPNYLAAIEFDPPDFPWMFSPAAPSGGRLLPWCVLAVVEKAPGVALSVRVDAPLPVLTIEGPADAARELPDLAESWAWAHGQVLEEAGGPSTPDLDLDPDGNLSRLVCPRRLKPETRYLACVLPAFDIGVARGRGLPVTGDHALPAWTSATVAAVANDGLPVYHFWEFSTAVEDDIESMARRLHGPEHAPADLGRRRIYAAAGHPDLGKPAALPAASRAVTMHGALRLAEQPGAPPDPVQPADLTARLASIVAKRTGPQLPAPLYGEWPANVHELPAAAGWLRELNTEVGHRIAAALGAEVVRRHQEDFVQAAWEQAGQAREANRLAGRARLSAAVLERLVARHVAPRDPDAVLTLAGPLLAAVATVLEGEARPTVAATLDDSSVPAGAWSAAYRRLASTQRQAVKRAIRRSGLAPGAGLIGLTAASAALVEPAPAVPDGLTGVRDRAALRPDAQNMVSLHALGLPGQTTLNEVAKLEPMPGAVPSLPSGPRQFFPPAELPAVISQITGRPARPRPGEVPPMRPPRPVTDATAVNAFNAALTGVVQTANRAPTTASFVAADVAGLGGLVASRLDARAAVARRVTSMVEHEAYDPFLGIQPFPVMPESTFQHLDALEGSWVLPEAAGLEADTAILLRTNREFTTAFLVGLNHEMNSELLWRGYPTDQRGTPFQRFWARVDGGEDILPIHLWTATDALGVAGAPAGGAGDQIVLLLRGRLLRRYPDMVVYATKGTPSAPGTSIPPEGAPMFFARLAPDINLVGFPLTPAQLAADQWWFVLEQQLTAPRFGFDVGDAAADHNKPWADQTWTGVGVAGGAHIKLSAAPFASGVFAGRGFGATADQVAVSLLQRPVRVALHRDRLLAHPGGGA